MCIEKKPQHLRHLHLRCYRPDYFQRSVVAIGWPNLDHLQTNIRSPEGLPLWAYQSNVRGYLLFVLAQLITIPRVSYARRTPHRDTTQEDRAPKVSDQTVRAHALAERLCVSHGIACILQSDESKTMSPSRAAASKNSTTRG